MKSEVFNQSRCAVLRAASLYYLEGCSQKSIAQQLDVSVPTVSRLLKKGQGGRACILCYSPSVYGMS